MPMKPVRGRVLAALFVLMLVAAACSADDGADSAAAAQDTSVTTAAPSTTASAEEETAEMDDMDEMDEADHDGDHHHATVEAGDDMSVALTVDEVGGGWRVSVATTGFEFAPESKDGPHVPGEGHAHLYVDGAKVETLLEPTFVIESLDPGERTISVDLRSNDHALYQLEDTPLESSVVVEVEGEVADADAMITIEVAVGAVVEDLGRVEVQAGDIIELTVTADVADEVHVHGFDVYGDVAPGDPAEMRFEAAFPGVYEVELESAGLLLFELLVNG